MQSDRTALPHERQGLEATFGDLSGNQRERLEVYPGHGDTQEQHVGADDERLVTRLTNVKLEMFPLKVQPHRGIFLLAHTIEKV